MNERMRYKMVQDISGLKKKIRYRYRKIITPIRDNMIVFESYHGDRYADNVRAIYEQMLLDERFCNYKFVWAFNTPEEHMDLYNNNRTFLVKKGSLEYYNAYASSHFWINNVSIPDYLKPTKNQIYIEAWHGTPLKRLGCDISVDSDPRQSPARMHKRYRAKGKKITYFLSPSPYYTQKLSTAFDLTHTHNADCMIETGYPRNDALFHYTDADVLEIKTQLNIPLGKKVVLYTPTWRDTEYTSKKGFNYIDALNTDKLMAELGDDYILLFRAHHQVGSRNMIHSSSSVIDVTNVDDINELYIISDLMVTDYSSTMFDYANL